MEQNRAYYENAYLCSFTAEVTSCKKCEGGYKVTLSHTCFYPEGGGQPWDLGTVGDADVLAVTEEGAEVIHLCSKPVSGTVECRIDFQRRFDFMQQHCGEHILCGIIHKAHGYHNVGFHMGADTVTMDVDGPLTKAQLAEAERRANEAVWENLPVKTFFPTEAELPGCVYRTKKPLPYPVRLVEIPGYDICACCGLHVAFTGEIGLIKILSAVGFRGGTRIELVCGRRAYEYVARVMEENAAVSAAFSAKPLEIGRAAREMNEKLAREKFRYVGLQKKLYDAKAQEYAGQGLGLCIEENLTGNEIRDLCGALSAVAEIGAVCSVQGQTCTVVLMSKAADVRTLGQRLKEHLKGKGGGKADCFQVTADTTPGEVRRLLET